MFASAGCAQTQASTSMTKEERTKSKLPEPQFPYLIDESGHTWDQNLCDIGLVVEELELPVHHCFLAKYSRVLKECISSTGGGRAAASKHTLIPMDDSLQSIMDMLQIVYSGASEASLEQLTSYPLKRCHEAIKVMDKYDLQPVQEKIYEHILAKAADASAQDAISWAALAHAMHRKSMLATCEQIIAAEAEQRDLARVIKELPLASALRILQHMICLINSEAYPNGYCDGTCTTPAHVQHWNDYIAQSSGIGISDCIRCHQPALGSRALLASKLCRALHARAAQAT